MSAQHAPEPWRIERRLINGRRCILVLRGYGSGARYMTDASGRPQQFTPAEARAAIAKATGSAS